MNKKQFKCALCCEPINKYQPTFNHLIINKSQTVDICSTCIDRFTTWQRKILADIFPTKNAKKWRDKN